MPDKFGNPSVRLDPSLDPEGLAKQIKGKPSEVAFDNYVNKVVERENIVRSLEEKHGGPINFKDGKNLQFQTSDRHTFSGFSLTNGSGEPIRDRKDVTAYMDAIGQTRLAKHHFDAMIKQDFPNEDPEKFSKLAINTAKARRVADSLNAPKAERKEDSLGGFKPVRGYENTPDTTIKELEYMPRPSLAGQLKGEVAVEILQLKDNKEVKEKAGKAIEQQDVTTRAFDAWMARKDTQAPDKIEAAEKNLTAANNAQDKANDDLTKAVRSALEKNGTLQAVLKKAGDHGLNEQNALMIVGNLIKNDLREEAKGTQPAVVVPPTRDESGRVRQK